MQAAISVRNLHKTFHSSGQQIHAINGINLDVKPGEVLGILGPNGAGKTTFLNALSTLLLADSGQIQILGIESKPSNFKKILPLINMSSGYPNYAFSLTVAENLEFYGRLYGLTGKVLKDKIQEVMSMFALIPYANRRFDELSSGTKQRLSLAKSLLNDPKVLFLDEPTIGLDPDVAIQTREAIKKVLRERQMTVLFTSHNMAEIEELCERVVFIREGKILKLSTVDELKRMHQTDDLEEVFIKLARSTEINSDSPLASEAGHQLSGDLKINRVNSDRHYLFSFINRCYAFSFRSVKFAIRNLFVMTDLFFWPMVVLISMGLMLQFVAPQGHMKEFVLIGALASGVLQVAQLDVGYTILYELWSKSLKHTLLTPVGVAEGVIGTLMVGIIRSTLTFVLMAVFSVWAFGFQFPSVLATAIFIFGLMSNALLLGIIVNILILSFGQKVEITAWMFGHLFLLLCGVYYPISILPQYLQNIAMMVPITHFLEYFRGFYGFAAHSNNSLTIAFGLTLVYLIILLNLLHQAYIRARQKGVVIRLSE